MKHIIVTACTAVLVAGLSLCGEPSRAEGPRSPTMYTAHPSVSPEFAVPPAAKPAPDVRHDKRSTNKHRKQGSKQHRSWWS